MKKNAKKGSENKKAGQAVGKELNELGRKVEAALKAAAQSGHVRGIREEVTSGLRNVGTKLAVALDAARKSEEGRQVQKQLNKVVSSGKTQGAEAAKQMRANLATGMQALSKELQNIARKLGR